MYEELYKKLIFREIHMIGIEGLIEMLVAAYLTFEESNWNSESF